MAFAWRDCDCFSSCSTLARTSLKSGESSVLYLPRARAPVRTVCHVSRGRARVAQDDDATVATLLPLACVCFVCGVLAIVAALREEVLHDTVGEVGGDGEEGEGHKELHHYLKGVDPLPSALSRHEQTQPTRLSHDEGPGAQGVREGGWWRGRRGRDPRGGEGVGRRFSGRACRWHVGGARS